MIEIERKFLLKSDGFKREAFTKAHIIQGFLSTHKKRTVRVRIEDSKGFLTVKGLSCDRGLSRFEWEKNIELTDAQNLIKLCKPHLIDKVRYKVIVDQHLFEIDVFRAKNKGLILAEVELRGRDERFPKPKWLGEEVTGEKKYYNAQLSKKPYCKWGY